MDGQIDVLPVAIGVYDHHERLEVDGEVRRLVALLEEFGGQEVPWPADMVDRGADAVGARLLAWSRPRAPADTVLYWIGHGWSDGTEAALAHARSPRTVADLGVSPAQLARPLSARQAIANGRWAMVVVETCWSSRFVGLLSALLLADWQGADGALLVGVSGDGAVRLGEFTEVLADCLRDNFRADGRIELWQLARELERRLPGGRVVPHRLGDAALVRRVAPVAATISAPLDVLGELEAVVAGLPDDERRHFLVKAQGAEDGEVSWFFEGRERERAEVVAWLRVAEQGLLVVTGRAGAGKSALLGDVLVRSLPELREALARAGLVDLLPAGELPPNRVFDAVVHLTGLTAPQLIDRIGRAAGLTAPPDDSRSDQIDWLVDGLRSRSAPFTLLADALDEAQDPVALARSVLRRVAGIGGVRLLVGTRASTHEGPDDPEPADRDLLDALGEAAHQVWLRRDERAVARYVTRRLLHSGELHPADVERAAAAIGARDREFLYARLAVYELLADPTLLDPSREARLERLLDGDHRDLFANAVARLAGRRPAAGPLLEALALARGRGLPLLDGIWTAVANALAEGAVAISDADVSGLLVAARPYVTVDAEAGQTVYRLAHRTFADHFLHPQSG